MTVSIVSSATAANGRIINFRVERVGAEGTKNCWRATVTVDGTRMSHAHHDTAAEADNWALGMQSAYLDVHGGRRK